MPVGPARLLPATSNVCKYNFALEKRTNILNIVTDEIDPSLGNAKYYVYSELNCNDVDLDWDIERVMDNDRAEVIIGEDTKVEIIRSTGIQGLLNTQEPKK